MWRDGGPQYLAPGALGGAEGGGGAPLTMAPLPGPGMTATAGWLSNLRGAALREHAQSQSANIERSGQSADSLTCEGRVGKNKHGARVRQKGANKERRMGQGQGKGRRRAKEG